MFRNAFEVYPTLRETGHDVLDSKFRACLPPTLIKAFREIREHIILNEYFQRTTQAPTVTQAAYMYNKCCNSQFLAVRSAVSKKDDEMDKGADVDTDHDPQTPGFQEPCRLALLIFWNANTQLHRPDSLLYQTLALSLKSALEQTHIRHLWEESFSVSMWICLLGAFATTDDGERPWFISRMADGMQIGGRTDWEWMRRMLHRLFYLEHIYRDDFEQCWMDACEIATAEQ